MIYKSSWSNRFEVKPARWVYNPTPESRSVGYEIIKLLNSHWDKPFYYYHLRSGGHIEALSLHLENKFFSTVDIKDFFGSISRTRITRALKKFLKYDDARKIAKISTVKAIGDYPHSHHLPYGFVQSPLLASICLFDSSLGIFLNDINNKSNFSVSVYMDDIIISSNDKKDLKNLFKDIQAVARKSKFLINDVKSTPASESAKAFNIIFTHKNMKIEYDRFIKLQHVYSTSKSEFQKNGIKSYVNSVNGYQATLLI